MCNIHNKKYIWISEIDHTNYCDKCINQLISNSDNLTSDNWEKLYMNFIDDLQLENYKGV